MKNYEIAGLKFASNVYYELKRDRINRFLDKVSPFILICLVCWLGYMSLLLEQYPTMVTPHVTALYLTK